MIRRLPMKPSFPVVLLLASVNVAFADRNSPLPDLNGGYLTFYLDNDLFGGEDQDYTNGARLSWISEDRKVSEIGSVQRLLRPISGDSDSLEAFQRITGFEDPEKIRYNFGFSLTQLMFTPEDFEPHHQPEGQRRYAGWLGLGFSLHVKDDNILNSIEFTIGITGSNSFAETTQDFIHSLRGIDKFNGWQDQIPNEVTADLSYVQKRRTGFLELGSGHFRMDGLTEWGVRLGTYRTDAHLGGMVRFGYNLPGDFSDARLSTTAYSHQYFGSGTEYDGNWSVYLTLGTGATGVAHDASLDGPLFHDFHTGNHREAFFVEIYGGIAIRYKDVEFSYVHTLRTQEYREQEDAANFGSIAMRVRF